MKNFKNINNKNVWQIAYCTPDRMVMFSIIIADKSLSSYDIVDKFREEFPHYNLYESDVTLLNTKYKEFMNLTVKK